MAIAQLIAGGIGFSPGSTAYLPTLGFSIGEAVEVLLGVPVLTLSAAERTYTLTATQRTYSLDARQRVYTFTLELEQ